MGSCIADSKFWVGCRHLERAFDNVAVEYGNLLEPYAWPPLPNRTGPEVRSQPYIEYLESRILLLEERLRGVHADHIPRSTRRTLDTYIQELQRVTGVRRPEARPLPFIVRYAIELQQLIADLETRIEDFCADEEDLPIHDTLDSLRNKLRQAKLRWDRLPPIHGLPPPVPTSRRRHRLQLHQIFRRANVNVTDEPRPRVLRGVGIIMETPDARANTAANDDYNFMTEPRGELDSPDIPAVQTSATSRDTFSDLFRGHPTRRASASTPTIVAPQTHGEANHAVNEDLATDDNTNPGAVSEEGLDEGSNRTITEGTSTDGSANPNPTSEDELRPDAGNPIAAAPPRSPPHRDPGLEQADSVAQPSRLARQYTPWTNFSSSQRGRPDSTPDVGSQEVRLGIELVPFDDDGGGGGGSNPPATTAPPQSTTPARLSLEIVDHALDDDDAFEEELYSDNY